MKKIFTLLLTAILFSGFTSTVMAFDDIAGLEGEKAILALKEKGIIHGVSKNEFAPKAELTYAQGIALIDKAFDFNLAHFMFIKEPLASDNFTNVKDNEWYSEAFVHTFLNGMKIDQDVDPNEKLTKEQFTDLVFQAITLKNDIAFIEIWKIINDEADVSPEYMNSIQKMIIAGVTPLEDGNFYPKKVLNREEAAIILHRALQFVDSSKE